MKNIKIIMFCIILFLTFAVTHSNAFASNENNFYGTLDSPVSQSKAGNTLIVSGWAFNVKEDIKSINIFIDGEKISEADYGTTRKDVIKAFPEHDEAAKSGFQKEISLTNLSLGTHNLNVIAESKNGRKYNIANVNFIREQEIKSVVDSPSTDNINLPDDEITISGWAFNETGIKDIEVFLNGDYLGKANYGIKRKDVNIAFPNHEHSLTSGFNFVLNTKKIDFEEHTIKLSATSNNGEKTVFFEKNMIKKNNHIVLKSLLIVLLLILFIVYIYKLAEKKPQIKSLRFFVINLDIAWFVLSIIVKTLLFSHYTATNYNLLNIITTLSILTLIGLAIKLIRSRIFRTICFVLTSILLTLIIFADLLYTRYFDDVTSVIMIQYIQQVNELGGSISRLIEPTDILFFVDYLITILLILLKNSSSSIRIKSKCTLLIGTASIFVITAQIVQFMKDDSNIFKQTYSNKEVVNNIGIVNYHIYDIYKFTEIAFNKPKVTAEEKEHIKSWFTAHNTFYPNQPFFGAAENKNLLLIQAESLQSFVIGLRVNGKEVTPNLNKLVKSSFYFDNFYDQTYSGRTSDGELTTLTSLYPLQEGSVNFRYPNTNVDTLPKVMKKSGYTTFSAHAFKGEFWNRKPMHSNYGFEQSHFAADFIMTEPIGWGLSDKEFFSQSVEKIKVLEEPFFAFLITLTNHHPYDSIPEEYKELDVTNINDSLMQNYLHSVHYADRALGELLNKLKGNDLYNNTVIALYGDHDAGLDPNAIWEISDTNMRYKKTADKLPFLIHLPNNHKELKSDLAGQLDITPTLLHLLGIDSSNFSFMGENLFGSSAERILPSRDGSFVTDDLLYEGSCVQLENGTQLEVQGCQNYADKVTDLFKISDVLIKTDILDRKE